MKKVIYRIVLKIKLHLHINY